MCLLTCQSEKKHIEIELYLILVFFHFNELYLCKQREIFLWVFSYLSEEKHPTGLELLVFFTFINFFGNINLEHNLLPDCACLWTVYYQFTSFFLCKNVCQASLPSFYCTTGNILFRSRSMPNGMEITCSTQLFNSASLSWVGDNSLVHKLRVMTAVKATFKCNICPISCTIPLKSISLWKNAINIGW